MVAHDDFLGWLKDQAILLRSGDLAELDAEHVAEALEDMASEIRSRTQAALRRAMVCLVRLERSPEDERKAAWIEELLECQAVLQDRLGQSSSLEGELPELLKASWNQARRSLAIMARIDELPEDCPFSLDALLDREA